jgi:hypothetical protein
MARDAVGRARGLVKFVIIWLIALYIFEVVHEARWFVGAGAVVVAGFVNVYSRKKAAAAVEANLAFHLWLYAPVVVLFALPLLLNAILTLTDEQERTWTDHLVSLLPFLLKLGVPAVALIWAYVTLGKLPAGAGTEAPAPTS